MGRSAAAQKTVTSRPQEQPRPAEVQWVDYDVTKNLRKPNPPHYSKPSHFGLHIFFLALTGLSIGIAAGIYLVK